MSSTLGPTGRTVPSNRIAKSVIFSATSNHALDEINFNFVLWPIGAQEKLNINVINRINPPDSKGAFKVHWISDRSLPRCGK